MSPRNTRQVATPSATDLNPKPGVADSAKGTAGTVPPKGLINVRPLTSQLTQQMQHQLMQVWPHVIRPATASIAHPYFIPGSTYHQLWDWDAMFMAVAAPDRYLEPARGSLLNLLAGVRPDGEPPKLMRSTGHYHYNGNPLPIHGQFACLLARRLGAVQWLAAAWPTLVAVRDWFETHGQDGEGYFVWSSFRGNGVDNNPAVYGRPPRSAAGVDLATWHYRENVAMATLARAFDHERAAHAYDVKAEQLRHVIQTQYWDPCDGFFYNIDRLTDRTHVSRQAVTWQTHLKFRSWTGFFPLWAGVATPQQAEALRQKMLDPAEFLAPAGIRSHSARDPVYNNMPLADPSNWQGPVWVLNTCLCAYGLARYGFSCNAADVGRRLVETLTADLEANGCVHEYYHGDSGQPLSKPGFLSWNLMAIDLLDHLAANHDPTALGHPLER
ncbi:MAG: trehalase family glycosidase [Phycisphaeraceae bacterium]